MWLEYILIVPNDCSSELFQLVIVEYIIFYLLCALQWTFFTNGNVCQKLFSSTHFRTSDIWSSVPCFAFDLIIHMHIYTKQACICMQLYESYRSMYISACLVPTLNSQKVLQYPSHQILRYVHGALNVDEKNWLHSLVGNYETNILSLISLWSNTNYQIKTKVLH
jgi:hypothetical protein